MRPAHRSRPAAAFCWTWPRLVRVYAAEPVTRIALNRYNRRTLDQATIGLAVYVRGNGLSLLWKRSHYRCPR